MQKEKRYTPFNFSDLQDFLVFGTLFLSENNQWESTKTDDLSTCKT
jgi:hypothetical protein